MSRTPRTIADAAGSQGATAQPWHTLTPGQVAAELGSDLEHGLSVAEAQARLARYGPNQLPETAAVSPWRIFLAQLRNVMTALLVVATLVALLLGDELDAAAIVVVIFLNALLGFANEYRAERAVQALKALVVPRARVVRDGAMREVPAGEFVPGDLVAFEAGDRIPADARLVEARSLRLDESALTGESVAVDKDAEAAIFPDAPLAERETMVYLGTAAVQGRGRAIVVATGPATEVGRISTLMGEARPQEQTPLQERLDRLARYLALAALGIAAVMALLGLGRGEALLPMLETSLALAIAAVPEGLPAVTTIALALGIRRTARRKAIVRKLAAVETLGSTDVICTDKTGTLTQNQMTVRELDLGGRRIQVTGVGYEPAGELREKGERLDVRVDAHLRLLLRAGLLCNDASLRQESAGQGTQGTQWSVVGDPTEGALVVAAAKAGLDRAAEAKAFPRVQEVPFDARTRRMATVHKVVEGSREEARLGASELVVFAKGAPEAILPDCTRLRQGDEVVELSAEARRRLEAENAALAGRALRVLALAFRSASSPDEEPFADLVFLGFVGMIDPPRPEAKEAVRRCQEAGSGWR